MKKLSVERLGHLPKVAATKWRNLDSNPYYWPQKPTLS